MRSNVKRCLLSLLLLFMPVARAQSNSGFPFIWHGNGSLGFYCGVLDRFNVVHDVRGLHDVSAKCDPMMDLSLKAVTGQFRSTRGPID